MKNEGENRSSGNETFHFALERGKGQHFGKGPRGYIRSDDAIKDEAYCMLAEHHFIDAAEIIVEVERGTLTLRGSVARRAMRYAAEDLVEDIPGVHHVMNLLKVAEAGL